MLEGNMDASDKGRFPCGTCLKTAYTDGWIDIAAGPFITVRVIYCNKRNDGLDRKIILGIKPPPNVLEVEVKCDKPMLRAFGCLAKDILAIKVSSMFLCLNYAVALP